MHLALTGWVRSARCGCGDKTEASTCAVLNDGWIIEGGSQTLSPKPSSLKSNSKPQTLNPQKALSIAGLASFRLL